MRTIVFDVNETLLDLKSLQPQFERLFGDGNVLRSWFSQLLQGSLVATLTGSYRDFGELAKDALGIVAQRQGVSLSDDDAGAVLEEIRRLPPHPEVKGSLGRLRGAGFRLATLTNSPYRVVNAQLENAGLAELFSQVLSVEEVRLFKPHPAVYQMAAEKLGIEVGDMRLVAAHNWDTTGAIRAGCKAAFVARPGMVLGELDEQPDIIAKTLEGVAEAIILRDA